MPLFKLNRYDIVACGYYKRETSDEAPFGTYESILENLYDFFHDNSSTPANLRTYRHNHRASSFPIQIERGAEGTYLATFYTPTTDNNNNVLYLNTQQQVRGIESLSREQVDPTSTPGYPTFFWLVPDQEVMCTIKVDGWHMNKGDFDRYMQGFIKEYNPEHCRLDDNDNVGYYRSSSATESEYAYPRFRTQRTVVPAAVDFLMSNSHRINRVIVRSSQQQQGPNPHVKFLSRFLKKKPKQRDLAEEEKRTGYAFHEMEFFPDDDTLHELIERANEDGSEDKIGVKFMKQTDIKWLDEARKQDEINVRELNLGAAGFPNAATLIQIFEAEYDRIFDDS
jgi:hypothetical protein